MASFVMAVKLRWPFAPSQSLARKQHQEALNLNIV